MIQKVIALIVAIMIMVKILMIIVIKVMIETKNITFSNFMLLISFNF